MAAVYAGDEAQHELAEQSRRELEARGLEVRTPIVARGRFYLAEDYHQKYSLRHHDALLREFASYTPRQLVDSTVAARLNGYLAGNGSAAQLDRELPSFGLSAQANAELMQRVSSRRR
jgi:peptide-methionine (S)-S-oxide reductase